MNIPCYNFILPFHPYFLHAAHHLILFYNFIMQEEQSKILATNSEILNLQLRSCKDSYFLNNKLLQKHIEEIGKFIYFMVFKVSSTYALFRCLPFK